MPIPLYDNPYNMYYDNSPLESPYVYPIADTTRTDVIINSEDNTLRQSDIEQPDIEQCNTLSQSCQTDKMKSKIKTKVKINKPVSSIPQIFNGVMYINSNNTNPREKINTTSEYCKGVWRYICCSLVIIFIMIVVLLCL